MLREVILGEKRLEKGKTAICVPVCGSSKEEVLWETEQLLETPCDLVEWRADCFCEDIVSAVGSIKEAAGGKPLLLTYRSKAEGGKGSTDDKAYREMYQEVIMEGKADAVDIELSRPCCRELVEFAKAHGVTTFVSYHNFERTLSDQELEEKLAAMEEAGADIPKLALMPQDFADVLRLAEFTMRASERSFPLVTVSMGKLGKLSRLCGGQTGSAITFAAHKTASAPGQMKIGFIRDVLDELAK